MPFNGHRSPVEKQVESIYHFLLRKYGAMLVPNVPKNALLINWTTFWNEYLREYNREWVGRKIETFEPYGRRLKEWLELDHAVILINARIFDLAKHGNPPNYNTEEEEQAYKRCLPVAGFPTIGFVILPPGSFRDHPLLIATLEPYLNSGDLPATKKAKEKTRIYHEWWDLLSLGVFNTLMDGFWILDQLPYTSDLCDILPPPLNLPALEPPPVQEDPLPNDGLDNGLDDDWNRVLGLDKPGESEPGEDPFGFV